MPKVSIIVPNFNHEKYLQQRLDSIFDQTYQDFEVILLDDCSTDNSRVILEKYRNHPKVSHLIYNKENSGTSYKQWYKGIEYAKGELIWIAESDDWCDLRFLETLIPFFNDSKVSLVFSGVQYIYTDNDKIAHNRIWSTFYNYNGENFIKEKMLAGNNIPNASMVIFRKENYTQIKNNGFVNMRLCGDWFLWNEIISKNNLVFVPQKLNYLRRHSENATNKHRKEGLDFTEGLETMVYGFKLCNNYDNNHVYSGWLNRYYMYRKYWNFKTLLKVHLKIISVNRQMYFFMIPKILKTFIKTKLNF